jgi:hypothetical protein
MSVQVYLLFMRCHIFYVDLFLLSTCQLGTIESVQRNLYKLRTEIHVRTALYFMLQFITYTYLLVFIQRSKLMDTRVYVQDLRYRVLQSQVTHAESQSI